MQLTHAYPSEGYLTGGRYSTFLRDLTREGKRGRRIPNGTLVEVVIPGHGRQEVRVPSVSAVKVKMGQKCLFVNPKLIPTVVNNGNRTVAGFNLQCDEILPMEGE